jgi:hypothetical protein
VNTGADVAIAVGTIATAVLAAAGLAVSLWINGKDRSRADQQADLDRKASADLAASDRAAIREDAQRRHIVNLLLELGKQVGEQATYAGGPQSGAAAQRIGLLLNALPPECAYTVRQKFNCVRQFAWAGGVGEKMGWLELQSVEAKADPAQMNREIAFDIDRYLTSGEPPDDAWSDLEKLKAWERARWPRA